MIFVTGDSYIDSPLIGVAVIKKVLQAACYKVGIISQPDTQSEVDITRLGEPRLFWGVPAGSIDAIVANYSATGRPRWADDYTPGSRNTNTTTNHYTHQHSNTDDNKDTHDHAFGDQNTKAKKHPYRYAYKFHRQPR